MGKKKKSARKQWLNKQMVKELIVRYFNEQSEGKVEADFRKIAAYVGAKEAWSRKLVSEALYDMTASSILKQTAHGCYTMMPSHSSVEGIITVLRGGRGSLTMEGGNVITIPAHRCANALDGDRVRVVYRFNRRLRGLEGEVTAILKRARESFVGIVQVQRGYAFLVPDSRQMPYDIYIPLEELHGAQHGEKAIARITDWPRDARNPFGSIMEVLGKPGVHEVEMHAILAEFDLPYKYPETVTRAAEQLEAGITPEEVAKRRDFRSVTTITIDPASAKDFDDALSFRSLGEGRYEVGVHIADVTHYVTPDSIIDREAYERATSVYLVDRTVPMLPEKLSNDICSLRPNEDKLAFSVVFEMNGEAEVLDTWMGRTVIRSVGRLTYEQAQEVILGGEGDFSQEISVLNTLAQTLRRERFAKGAVDFVSEEVQFQLDDAGRPLAVIPRENNESHQLIEEFMLLANRTVAEFVGKPKPNRPPRPFVYRVHDRPTPEKLDSFCKVLAQFGHPFKGDITRMSGTDITHLVTAVRGRPEQRFIDILAIRSMAKAIYTTKNIGHFGLAFSYYTHFTSPIRRYPDMMVHRILTNALANEKSPPEGILEERCLHSSDMEKRATEAERASVKYKQVEFMSAHLGEQFDGIISGVAEFGLFVEIEENKCEGMVSMRDLLDDYYAYNPDEFSIKGQRYGRSYRLGDRVKIEVLRADLMLKHLDFALIEHEGRPVEPMEQGGGMARNTGTRKPKSKGKKGRSSGGKKKRR